jgi:hypothetical protein
MTYLLTASFVIILQKSEPTVWKRSVLSVYLIMQKVYALHLTISHTDKKIFLKHTKHPRELYLSKHTFNQALLFLIVTCLKSYCVIMLKLVTETTHVHLYPRIISWVYVCNGAIMHFGSLAGLHIKYMTVPKRTWTITRTSI